MQWAAFSYPYLPIGWTVGMIAANPITVAYDKPGIYTFGASALFTGCGRMYEHFSDTVGVVTNFRYQARCAPGLLDSVILSDYTATLPFYGIDTVRWFVDGVYAGTGANVLSMMTAGTTHSIDHFVYGTKPGGTYVCSDSRTITMPSRPVALYTFATSPICETVPIDFTPSTGFVGYSWNFGDSAYSLLPITQRAYTWGGFASVLKPYSVTLTVTDSIGCKADTTQAVGIFHNILSGTMGNGGAICPASIPYPIDYLADLGSAIPDSFLWSVDITTLVPTTNIYGTGSYWVTVKDGHSCQFTTVESEKIKVLKVPSASIFGVQHYCVGDEVQLYGYEGDGVTYQWFRDGTLIGTDKELHDPNRPVGIYAYQLVITVTDITSLASCSDTSDVDMIRVYGLPAPPVIALHVTNCDNYQLQLTASEPVSGTYNWSNGAAGPVDYIDNGGPYRVWFTDLHGCVRSNDIDVPMSPDYYFSYFPTGCYNLCHEQLPLTLLGPPCVDFTSSSWLMGGTTVAGGSGAMVPYSFTGDGKYQWTINNGLCTKTSPEMDVTTVDCNKCQGSMSASLVCDSTDPANYTMHLSFVSPVAGTSYTIGTSLGPVAPFSGVADTGTITPTLTYTTLSPSPLPDSVTVELELTYPSGDKCFEKIKIPVPYCHWTAERGQHNDEQHNNTPTGSKVQVSSALLVYPNPTSGNVTVSYDYGSEGATGRVLAIYDAMGRRVGYTIPLDTHGNWLLNTSGWTPGVYMIRMEGDGKALQVQRMVIVH